SQLGFGALAGAQQHLGLVGGVRRAHRRSRSGGRSRLNRRRQAHTPAALGAGGVAFPATLLALELVLEFLRPLLRPHGLPLIAAVGDGGLLGPLDARLRVLVTKMALEMTEHDDRDDESE